MSSLQTHLWQARHNESLASQLLIDLNYKDWIVTVAFYAALHYVEAAFTKNPNVQHAETSWRPDFRISLHTYREQLIFQNYPKEVLIPFRKLRNESVVARYLTTDRRQFLRMTVQEYFSDEDVKTFFQRDLGTIRQALSFT